MSRLYTVSFSATVTASGGDTDLFELTPAANKPIRLKGLVLSQIDNTTEATDEALRISIIRLPATVTSGNGTSTTPQPIDENDAAAGLTAETNGATVATTSGTAVTLAELGWITRNTPLEMWWPEDKYAPRVQNAGVIVVRLQTTLADDAVWEGTAYVEEY